MAKLTIFCTLIIIGVILMAMFKGQAEDRMKRALKVSVKKAQNVEKIKDDWIEFQKTVGSAFISLLLHCL